MCGSLLPGIVPLLWILLCVRFQRIAHRVAQLIRGTQGGSPLSIWNFAGLKNRLERVNRWFKRGRQRGFAQRMPSRVEHGIDVDYSRIIVVQPIESIDDILQQNPLRFGEHCRLTFGFQ